MSKKRFIIKERSCTGETLGLVEADSVERAAAAAISNTQIRKAIGLKGRAVVGVTRTSGDPGLSGVFLVTKKQSGSVYGAAVDTVARVHVSPA